MQKSNYCDFGNFLCFLDGIFSKMKILLILKSFLWFARGAVYTVPSIRRLASCNFFHVKINNSFSGWPCPALVRWIKFKPVYCVLSGLLVHERVHSPLEVQRHIPDSLWKSQTFLSLFRRWLFIGGVKGEQGNEGWFHQMSQKSNVMHLAQPFPI